MARVENRKSLRVRLSQSHAMLHHQTVRSMKIDLLDFGDGGARCRTKFIAMSEDEQLVRAWRQLVNSSKVLQVELIVPSEPQPVRIDATVKHLRLKDEGEIEFGLMFQRMDQNKLLFLERARRAYAKFGFMSSGGGNAPDPGRMVRIPGMEEAGAPAAQAKMSNSGLPKVGGASGSGGMLKVQAPASASDSNRRSVIDIAKGLWGTVTGRPASASDAARQAVPASVSSAARQAVPSGTAPNFRTMKLGEILVKLGKLKQKQMNEAIENANGGGIKLGRYLLDNKLVSPPDLCRALSLQSGLPIVDLGAVKPSPEVCKLLPVDLLHQHHCIPFNKVGTVLYMASAQPLSSATTGKIENQTKCTVKSFLAQDDVILGLIPQYFA